MNTPLPPIQRKVSLRLSSTQADEVKPMEPEALESLLARAQAMGLPLHHDPQIAALLVSLRMRDDVPTLLYAAAASVLATVYDAAGE
ncbi:MAG: flagellar biosynthesis protein [Rhodanobacter sp.]